MTPSSHPVRRILSANLVIQVLGLAATFLSALAIGTSSFGILTSILLWTGFLAQIGSLSLPDTMVRLSRSDGDIMKVYGNGLWLTIAVSALCGGTLHILSKFGFMDLTRGQLLAATLLTALTLISACVASLEQRLENFGSYNRILVSTSVMTLVGTTVALRFHGLQTVSYLLWIRVLALAVPVAFQIYARRRYFLRPPSMFSWTLLRRSSSFHVTATLNAISSKSDQLIATALLTTTQMGMLGLILPFGRATRTFGYAVSTVTLGRVSRSAARAQGNKIISRSRRSAAAGGLVSAAACTMASICTFTALQIGTHGAWPATSDALIFCAIAFMYTASNALGAIVDLTIRLQRGQDVVLPGIISRAATAVLGAGIAWIMITQWELLGAGAAALISATIALIGLDVATNIYRRNRATSHD